ncbi:MAG TPA: rhodanese-like domain-containing protein [Actinomycetota bacterium]|nr:rhodanese-like domain-containing protein [Actinomycetota bacterium]
MTTATGLRAISADRVAHLLRTEGIIVDLRPPPAYLSRHIVGSVPLLYEAGPGLGGRARDLLPLDSRVILLEDGSSPLDKAADAFRGKGFEVVGYLAGGVEAWPGAPGGTPVMALANAPRDLALVHVADPGTVVEATWQPPARIPAEELWTRSGELDPGEPLGVLAGWGVWASAAIGILEHLGFSKLTFVRTRDAGERPPVAPASVFRAGGPA